jgi:Ca2+-binding EF-hand superfamily protein
MMKLATMMILTGLLMGIHVKAQDAAAEAKPEKKARTARARKGQDRGGMKISPRMMDTNKDMQISKEEIAAAMPEMKKRIEAAQVKLMAAFDKDKDGKLNEEELAKVTEMMAVMEAFRMIQQYDTDKDMAMSDEEMAGLQKRIEQTSEKMNKQMLEKFDANNDGLVDEKEMKAAKDKMRKRGKARNGAKDGEQL